MVGIFVLFLQIESLFVILQYGEIFMFAETFNSE